MALGPLSAEAPARAFNNQQLQQPVTAQPVTHDQRNYMHVKADAITDQSVTDQVHITSTPGVTKWRCVQESGHLRAPILRLMT